MTSSGARSTLRSLQAPGYLALTVTPRPACWPAELGVAFDEAANQPCPAPQGDPDDEAGRSQSGFRADVAKASSTLSDVCDQRRTSGASSALSVKVFAIYCQDVFAKIS